MRNEPLRMRWRAIEHAYPRATRQERLGRRASNHTRAEHDGYLAFEADPEGAPRHIYPGRCNGRDGAQAGTAPNPTCRLADALECSAQRG